MTVRPDGTRRIYSLDPRGVAAVREYFDQFWTTALAAYGDAVAAAMQAEALKTEEKP